MLDSPHLFPDDPSHSWPLRRSQLQINGESFHVIEQGQGPAVLFCHGFPDTADTWRSQLRALAQAGYRAIALDMRGFGKSYSPADASQYSGLHIAGDLVGVLDALDIPVAVLVGHDWGADHAQRAMLLRPDRFCALVSLSIPFAPRGERSTWDALREQGLGEQAPGKRYYAFGMMRPGAEADFTPAARSIPDILYWTSASPPPGAGWDALDPARSMLRPAPVPLPAWADPDYVRHTVQAFEASGFRGGLNHYRGAQATFDLMSAFKHAVIHQPSLYLWGAEDGLCRLLHPTPPTLAELREAQPGLVDVIRLENVGHWIQHEAAGRLNAELLGFLRDIAASGSVDAWAHPSSGQLGRPRGLTFTPLMQAASTGQAQSVAQLLDAGADVHAIEPAMGASVLHKAAQSGDAQTVALLLDRGAFVDQQSPVLGHTPLMDAVLHKHAAVVTLLLARGARTTIRNHWQQSALELARLDGLDAIAGLIEARDDADATQLAALTLIAAVKAGDHARVEALIAAGADVDQTTPMTGSPDDNYTPLAIAARDGRTEIVRVLLAAGADPRRKVGLMQGTPLHEASYFGHGKVIRAMRSPPAATGSATADLDIQGPYNGLTALHDAVWHGHADAAVALVEAGARLDLETHTGLTPRALAVRYGYGELARMLADAEAADRRTRSKETSAARQAGAAA